MTEPTLPGMSRPRKSAARKPVKASKGSLVGKCMDLAVSCTKGEQAELRAVLETVDRETMLRCQAVLIETVRSWFTRIRTTSEEAGPGWFMQELRSAEAERLAQERIDEKRAERDAGREKEQERWQATKDEVEGTTPESREAALEMFRKMRSE